MKKLIYLLALAPTLSLAQVRVQGGATFTLDLPLVLPQLVVIQPGIQVVPNVEYEVFHADGYYWTRRDDGWYRSPSPRAGWVYMPRGVPPGLSRIPPGQYRRWKGPPPGRPGVGGPEFRREERREDRREDRRERYEREERHEDHDRGDRGRGRGHGKHDD